MTRYKQINDEIIELTAEEISARQAEEAQAVIDKQTREDAEANEKTKKASGKQKLLDLGLTEEEVKALIGA
jgi:SOS response regulatory protein OraA/RecX